MNIANVILDAKKGMIVKTTDGRNLGKVTQIWFGTDPQPGDVHCDYEVCSYIQVQRGLIHQTVRYIPVDIIDQITAHEVILNLNRVTVDEQDWSRIPRWITEASMELRPERADSATRGLLGDAGNGTSLGGGPYFGL